MKNYSPSSNSFAQSLTYAANAGRLLLARILKQGIRGKSTQQTAAAAPKAILVTKGRSAETAPYRQTTVAANSAKTTKRDFLIFITDDMGYINIVNVESLFLMHTTKALPAKIRLRNNITKTIHLEIAPCAATFAQFVIRYASFVSKKLPRKTDLARQ